MCRKIGHRINETVRIVSHLLQVRGVIIPPLHILAEPDDILALDVRRLLLHWKEQFNIFFHLPVRYLLPAELFKLNAEVVHIFLRHEKRILRLLYLVLNVACVNHAETSLSCVQCQVQGIVAHHPYRGNGYLYRTGAVMCIAEYKIGADPLPRNDVFPRKPCKQPDFLPLLQ